MHDVEIGPGRLQLLPEFVRTVEFPLNVNRIQSGCASLWGSTRKRQRTGRLLLDASESGEWSDVLKSLLNQTTSIAIFSSKLKRI